MTHDVLIVGAGPGGYVAAIRARQLGLRVGLVEAAHLGGICLNWGCIPTKAMLKGTDLLHQAGHAERFGLLPLSPKIDPARLVARAGEVSGQLSAGVAFLLKKNGVDLIWGRARLAGAGVVEVADSGVLVDAQAWLAGAPCASSVSHWPSPRWAGSSFPPYSASGSPRLSQATSHTHPLRACRIFVSDSHGVIISGTRPLHRLRERSAAIFLRLRGCRGP